MKKFDLNIDQVLENWEVYHACREIIANALDEQKLTNTETVKIEKGPYGSWKIQDFGRGIEIEHFTQNESEEKLNHPNLIGRFGVGLKDALATFDRNNIDVKIESKNGIFTLQRYNKTGFDAIETLHVNVGENPNEDFKGTLVTLSGCADNDIKLAKSLFVDFLNVSPLEVTEYGEIYPNQFGISSIYINGVKVAEENNFMFSYNITSLNTKIKKALNRERTNVGRSAYTDRIKSILLSASNATVLKEIANNMNVVDSFDMKDELKWTDVGVYATKMLNVSNNYVFMSQKELREMDGNRRDILSVSGKEIIIVSDHVLNRLYNEIDDYGESISTVSTFMEDYISGFQYDFIKENRLTAKEKEILNYKVAVCDYYQAKHYVNRIKISETIRPSIYGDEARGEYNHEKDEIVIRRDQLSSKSLFLGTLIHELIHAKTGLPDVSREFEMILTDIIGDLAINTFSHSKQRSKGLKFKDTINKFFNF